MKLYHIHVHHSVSYNQKGKGFYQDKSLVKLFKRKFEDYKLATELKEFYELLLDVKLDIGFSYGESVI